MCPVASPLASAWQQGLPHCPITNMQPLCAQVGGLLEACRNYAAEARRLTPADEAEALAQEFARLQQSLEQSPLWQR